MTSQGKRVLYINLSREKFETRTLPELDKYIGGVGLGLKLGMLYREEDPVIFSVGPLNGFFPFASKTSVVLFSEDGVEDIYLGGSLSHRIKFFGVDAIVFAGRAKKPRFLNIAGDAVAFNHSLSEVNNLGLPGKKSSLAFSNNELVLDGYFKTRDFLLEEKFKEKNIDGFVLTADKLYEVKEFDKYEEIYKRLLARAKELTVEKSNCPSCVGCPMGCEKSRVGEIGGNVLIHSLVACTFAHGIYCDASTVFSCLNVLGYDYTHEDIENLPVLISEVLKELS